MAVRGVLTPSSTYALRQHEATSGRSDDKSAQQSTDMGSPAGYSANQARHHERCRNRNSLCNARRASWTLTTAQRVALPSMFFRHHHSWCAVPLRLGLAWYSIPLLQSRIMEKSSVVHFVRSVTVPVSLLLACSSDLALSSALVFSLQPHYAT
jgi:hypothetical protein